MFAPHSSRPPYYPSYSPPAPAELNALFHSHAYLPEHGMGAWSETWRLQHGVYLSEQKEAELASAEVQKTTAAMIAMQKMLKGQQASAPPAADAVPTASPTAAGPLSPTSAARPPADPATLVYTDPHAYAHFMERQSAQLFTMFSFPAETWSTLKNTPFLRYLYHGTFALDIGRLDTDQFNQSMQFLERSTGCHTLMLHDSWHMVDSSGGGASTKSAMSARFKSRGQPVHELNPLLGGGSAGAPKKGSVSIKLYPDEKTVLEKLELILPTFLARNSSSLVHIELAGLVLGVWDEIFRLLRRCTGTQRLYLRSCNIGDTLFAELVPVLKTHLTNLTHLQLSNIHLTAHSASLLASVVKTQSERRNISHWQLYLRQESAPRPSTSLLVPNSLGSQGLVSIDVSDNNLADKGVSLLAECLGRDTWIKALDVSGNKFGAEGLRAIVDALQENKTLLWLQVAGARELNTNLAADPLKSGSGGRAFVPRVASLGVGVSSGGPPMSDSSVRLLQKCDPHFGKRSKRLLLLFHQQIVDTTRFLTGRDPIPRSGASGSSADRPQQQLLSPRERARSGGPPLLPNAHTLFEKFFSMPPAVSKQHDGSFDNSSLPVGAKRSTSAQRKKKEPETTPLSPTLRSIAAQREQDARPASARRRSPSRRTPSADLSASTASPPPLPPTPTALAFLFPHLALVCPMDKLMKPDISLRPKPPRTDNSWPSGYEPKEKKDPSQVAASPSRAVKGPRLSASAKKKHAASESAAAAQASAASERSNDPLNAAFDYRNQDFRPYLRETCVGSTVDWVAAERAAYKRRMRMKLEREARRRGEEVPELRLETGASEEWTAEEESKQQHFAGAPASPLELSENVAASSASASRPLPARPPLFPVSPAAAAAPASASDASASSENAALAALVEENARLTAEMARMEARQRANERNLVEFGRSAAAAHASTAADDDSRHPAAASPFDLASVPSVLSAASLAAESDVQDPALLSYLESQFEKLAAYMSMLEQAVPSEPTPAQSAPRVHASVQRVESSASPVYVSSDSAEPGFAHAASKPSAIDGATSVDVLLTASSSVRPVVSRSASDDSAQGDDEAVEAQRLALQEAALAAPIMHAGEVQVTAESVDDASSIQEDLRAGVMARGVEMYGLDDE